jgi:serine protease Do
VQPTDRRKFGQPRREDPANPGALAGALLLLLAAGPAAAFAAEPPPAVQARPAAAEGIRVAEALEDAFIAVAEHVTPGVVTVRVEGSELAAAHGAPPGWPMTEPVRGEGSGFVVDGKGTILTNHHVVAGADRIDVVLADARVLRAAVVATDLESDVGVIRIVEPPADLRPVELGSSAAVRVGQFAIAIGSPLRLERSFTVGHVSALGRTSIGELYPGLTAPGFENLVFQDFIQVDTPINMGNSGGPLVDIHGRVIGINTAIAGDGGGGIGFAIPIDMAWNIAQQLVEHGRVSRGWLGVEFDELNPSVAETFGLGVQQGVQVTRIVEGSPAEQGKLQQDDVIVKIGGRAVASRHDLLTAVAGATVGEKTPVEVWRAGKSKQGQIVTLDVVIGERPPAEDREELALTPDARRGRGDRAGPSGRSEATGFHDPLLYELGLELEDPAGNSKGKAGSKPPKSPGVKVKSVEGDSLAEEAGLRSGDLIVQVNKTDVRTPQEVVAVLSETKKAFVPLLVQRDGKSKYMSMGRVK